MALLVIRPGMLTTIQDLGRWGSQGNGVPVAGPMDAYSHRLANRLIGNRDDAAALEVTLMGPELQASGRDVTCIVCGAWFDATVDGRSIDASRPFVIAAGARLRLGTRRRGARATVAVGGGIVCPPILGSRSTSVVSRMGPFDGRALAAGDVLPVGPPVANPRRSAGRALVMPDGGARLRCIVGPHEAMFTKEALETIFTSRFIVTPQSNRMGYRLEGSVLRHSNSADILSDATPIGSIQVPASGQPILLMADRQTTGGYPKIATVITADLPLAGQLAPGDWIEFVECTRAEAVEALRHQEAALGEDAL
jgi:antagonist of KipI